jgi:hypothetical protein
MPQFVIPRIFLLRRFKHYFNIRQIRRSQLVRSKRDHIMGIESQVAALHIFESSPPHLLLDAKLSLHLEHLFLFA